MKLIRTAAGKYKLTKKAWLEIGKKTGWIKMSDYADRFNLAEDYIAVIEAVDGTNEFDRSDLGPSKFMYPEDAKYAVEEHLADFEGAEGYVIDNNNKKIYGCELVKKNSMDEDVYEEGDSIEEWYEFEWDIYNNIDDLKKGIKKSMDVALV